LRDGLVAAGRSLADIEMIGGIRGRFPAPDGVADLDEALSSLPGQLAAGFGTICFKPSMYIDDAREVGRCAACWYAGWRSSRSREPWQHFAPS
jgi:hypothetical protein